MKLQHIKLLISLLATTLFLGCSSSGSSSSSTTYNGQLNDSFVENVDYRCGDGIMSVTNSRGEFNCNSFPITFSLNNLELGSITSIPNDSMIFPQELVGVIRSDINNTAVVAMARLLQSCDSDANTTNGIQILDAIKNSFSTATFLENDLAAYAAEANLTLISETEAIEHLSDTTELVDSVNALTQLPTDLKESLLNNRSTLTQELKNTLSYMGNEERLAYDIYSELYKTYPIKQLNNIATKSETIHIQTVQLLVKKYILDESEFSNVDLTELNYKDTNLSSMESGVYDISAIQTLYDTLLSEGLSSEQNALEVGCKVEVVDINDLDEYISLAQASNATDIKLAFEFLRNGSYSHYWAFDKGLKNMGITEGCCVAGTAYCHPEYPNNQMGRTSH